jgi:zeaxanthin glucosyltransferase
MRIGFVSHIVPGHANPISSLARTLQARGNEVLFFSMPDGAPFATAAGLKHVSFAEQEFPLGSALQAQAIQSRLQGHEATMFALKRLGDTCDVCSDTFQQCLLERNLMESCSIRRISELG